MTILYVSTGANKLKVFEVDDATGNFIRLVQTIDPIVDPLPELGQDGKPVPKTGTFGPVTEWVEKHPKYDLVYAFTSFWSASPAVVTTFRIVDSESGRLQKLGRVETGGLQAAHATFSPDQSILCVSHHNDGNVAFFDCSKDCVALSSPIKILSTPEVKPGTRTSKFPSVCPSIHHSSYSPNGKFLLTTDSSKQGRVWTYLVDKQGIPLDDTPSSSLKVTFVSPSPGWLAYTLSKTLIQLDYRIRRSAVHPNGRYVYLLFEMSPVLQVYEIDTNGKIFGDCLQEIPAIDPAYFTHGWGGKWTGVGISAPAELYVTESEVLISNRGMKTRMGSAESSIRIFGMEEDGAKLVPRQVLETPGPVRYFWMNKESTKIFSGTHSCQPPVVETYVRDEAGGSFTKVGEANVGMDVMCIAPLKES
mmetsp:Transcript_5793/g.10769  ORF Transcript_5793/g.10769 Transcript_5793/m.10769 type:complete len:418 (+) Transcript_5793:145-1398(+)